MTTAWRQLFSRLTISLVALCFFVQSQAQDSAHMRISLLTCTPGEELYSTFGHSALRLTDTSSRFDIVFNYGTFNFDDDGFYIKFIRGKLLYYLSTESFTDFRDAYQETGRGITEQVLQLTAEEKLSIYHAMINNLQDSNKFYKYDFLFDNCTTRLRDIIQKYKQPLPTQVAIVPAGTTFRNAIHGYLNRNKKNWSKLGIDILLGATTDAVMTTSQSQFLPDNLMKELDSSNVNKQLVSASSSLYPFQPVVPEADLFTPLVVFSGLFMLVFVTGFSKKKFVQQLIQGFDGLFFFLVGALGVLLIFMWFGTDHSMTKNNYNLLWAWPTHAVIAFFINSQKKWVTCYFGITAAGLTIVLLSWLFLPQLMNNELIPIVLLLIYRSAQKYLAPQTK